MRLVFNIGEIQETIATQKLKRRMIYKFPCYTVLVSCELPDGRVYEAVCREDKRLVDISNRSLKDYRAALASMAVSEIVSKIVLEEETK